MADQKMKEVERKEKSKLEKSKPGKQDAESQEKSGEKKKYRSKEIQASNIVRLGETNLNADKSLGEAIRGVKGIGKALGSAIAKVSGFEGRKLSELSDSEVKQVEAVIADPGKHGIPAWMLNRRKDPQTGSDIHLIASTLQFTRGMDINEMKKWKTYKGVRHAQGLPVRGQRTRGSFRKSGISVGVKKKKAEPAKASKK